MATPERVLVDTSALYAIRSATDLFHDRARASFERLKDTGPELWATSYTLVETVALLHSRWDSRSSRSSQHGAKSISLAIVEPPQRGIDIWRNVDED